MLKLSRLTDYALVILVDLASQEHLAPTSEIALRTGIPDPTVSKVLKMLTKSRIVQSTRGACGGYSLTKAMNEISVAEIISAIEGPISLTTCTSDDGEGCNISSLCPLSSGWKHVNDVINSTLSGMSINDLLANSYGPERREA